MTHSVIRYFFLSVCLLLSLCLHAQIYIDLPRNYSVFQRNTSNMGDIVIAGTYTNNVASSVQARLTRADNGQEVKGWTIIDAAPSKGQFHGTLSFVSAGWYYMEVRLMKSGTVLATTNLSRVGIGDVFLISGQSNSTGITSVPGTDGVDGVVTHHEYQGCNPHVPSLPNLQTVTHNIQNLGMTGESSWCYGKLGELLKNQTGYPVAFFNGGASGSSIYNWVESQTGTKTEHLSVFVGTYCGDQNPQGFPAPYYIFTKPLHYYGNIFGARAVLWHQGESESAAPQTEGGNTTYQEYLSRLQTHISNVRTEFGQSNLPWVISRVSRAKHITNASVINAQTDIVSSGNQLFLGPNTDGMGFNTRQPDDSIHFSQSGIFDLAYAWHAYLNNDFFNNSQPVSPATTPELSISVSGNQVSITAPSGYNSYRWVQGENYTDSHVSSNQTLVSNTNTNYRCYMSKSIGKDPIGQVIYSQKVNPAEILAQQTLPSSCSGSTYLSDYVPYSVQNYLGPIEFDKTHGGSSDGDGGLIKLNGTTFNKGIGMHAAPNGQANTEIVYKLPSGVFTTFQATVGIDDDVSSGTSSGSVYFKVYLNGSSSPSYTSPLMTSSSSNADVNVNISGATELKLVVENAGDNDANDHADWGDARISCCQQPNPPINLSVSNVQSRCITINWQEPSSGPSVTGYEIYDGSTLVAILQASSRSYTIDNLSKNSSYTFGVKAKSCPGFLSSLSTINTSTTNFDFSYPNGNQVCTGQSTTPTLSPSSISGGTFSIVSGSASINSSTGALTANSTDNVQVKYSKNAGTSCEDSQTITVTVTASPTVTPAATASQSIANSGSTVTFSTNANCSPGSLLWSNGNTSSSFQTTISGDVSYSVRCKNGICLGPASNVVAVKQIPDCPQTFVLNSTTYDLYSGTYNFKSSESIKATNKIVSPTKSFYTAGKRITMEPGFEVKPGSVFSAMIVGCP